MKVKPGDYAKALLESAKGEKNYQKIAQHFWNLLQKNGQYKDLNRILNSLDEEFAGQNGIVIAKVYSAEMLSQEQLEAINTKLAKHFGKEVIIRHSLKSEIVAGIVIKVGDREIDASILGKVEGLRKKLTTING